MLYSVVLSPLDLFVMSMWWDTCDVANPFQVRLICFNWPLDNDPDESRNACRRTGAVRTQRVCKGHLIASVDTLCLTSRHASPSRSNVRSVMRKTNTPHHHHHPRASDLFLTKSVGVSFFNASSRACAFGLDFLRQVANPNKIHLISTGICVARLAKRWANRDDSPPFSNGYLGGHDHAVAKLLQKNFNAGQDGLDVRVVGVQCLRVL